MSKTTTTWLGLITVALAAAVLSFAALRDLAILAGTPATLAWLLPICLDAAVLVATRLWLTPGVDTRARRFARSLALAMIALSVGGNAVSHWLTTFQVTPPWWAVVAVAAVPPAVLGAVAHLAALTVTGSTDFVHIVNREVVGTPPTEHPVGDDLAGRARYLVAAGEAEGKRVGRVQLARELGCSEHQARQVLRQLEQERHPTLHAVGGGNR